MLEIWQELRRQNIVEHPDEEEDTETADSLTAGMLVGLGSAALARLVSKGSDE
jgi:hypothetical protein